MFVQVNLETVRLTVFNSLHADVLVCFRVVYKCQVTEHRVIFTDAPLFDNLADVSDRPFQRNVITNRNVYLFLAHSPTCNLCIS